MRALLFVSQINKMNEKKIGKTMLTLITGITNMHRVAIGRHSQYSKHCLTLMPAKRIVILRYLTIDESILFSLLCLKSLYYSQQLHRLSNPSLS